VKARQRLAAEYATERQERGVCIDCGGEKPPKRARLLLCAPCQQLRTERRRETDGSGDYNICPYCDDVGHLERTCPIKAEEIEL
jgi:hypothetical protein